MINLYIIIYLNNFKIKFWISRDSSLGPPQKPGLKQRKPCAERAEQMNICEFRNYFVYECSLDSTQFYIILELVNWRINWTRNQQRRINFWWSFSSFVIKKIKKILFHQMKDRCQKPQKMLLNHLHIFKIDSEKSSSSSEKDLGNCKIVKILKNQKNRKNWIWTQKMIHWYHIDQ